MQIKSTKAGGEAFRDISLHFKVYWKNTKGLKLSAAMGNLNVMQ